MKLRQSLFIMTLVGMLVVLAVAFRPQPTAAGADLFAGTNVVVNHCGYYCWDEQGCGVIEWAFDTATGTFSDSEGNGGDFSWNPPTISFTYSNGTVYSGTANIDAKAASGNVESFSGLVGRWTMIRDNNQGCLVSASVGGVTADGR